MGVYRVPYYALGVAVAVLATTGVLMFYGSDPDRSKPGDGAYSMRPNSKSAPRISFRPVNGEASILSGSQECCSPGNDRDEEVSVNLGSGTSVAAGVSTPHGNNHATRREVLTSFVAYLESLTPEEKRPWEPHRLWSLNGGEPFIDGVIPPFHPSAWRCREWMRSSIRGIEHFEERLGKLLSMLRRGETGLLPGGHLGERIECEASEFVPLVLEVLGQGVSDSTLRFWLTRIVARAGYNSDDALDYLKRNIAQETNQMILSEMIVGLALTGKDEAVSAMASWLSVNINFRDGTQPLGPGRMVASEQCKVAAVCLLYMGTSLQNESAMRLLAQVQTSQDYYSSCVDPTAPGILIKLIDRGTEKNDSYLPLLEEYAMISEEVKRGPGRPSLDPFFHEFDAARLIAKWPTPAGTRSLERLVQRMEKDKRYQSDIVWQSEVSSLREIAAQRRKSER